MNGGSLGSREVTLEDWLKSISTNEEYGVLTAVKAHHWVQSGSGFTRGDEVVGRVYQQDRSWSPKEEAALITGRCSSYSQALPGEQTFKLFAYFGQEEAKSWHHIRCTGRALAEGGLTDTPDARGIITQGMAMGNLVVGRTFAKDSELWNMVKFLMTELKDERDFYAKNSREAETVAMELLREKAMNDHKQKMEELEFQRATHERQKLIAMLPAILRYVTKGQSIIPEGMADTAILEAVAQEIRKMPKDEQMTAMAAFPPALMVIVGDRLVEITARQEKEEERNIQLSKGRTSDTAADDRAMAASLLARAGLGPAATTKPQLSSGGAEASQGSGGGE